jgi:hypothetical protein
VYLKQQKSGCAVSGKFAMNDNAPSHSAQLMWQFLAKCSIPQMMQTTHLMWVSDFLLFPKWKRNLKRQKGVPRIVFDKSFQH